MLLKALKDSDSPWIEIKRGDVVEMDEAGGARLLLFGSFWQEVSEGEPILRWQWNAEQELMRRIY